METTLVRTLRSTSLSIAAVLILHSVATGQQEIVRVEVSSDVLGAVIYVDGQPTAVPATFSWNAGTKHVLATDRVQDEARPRTRFRFLKWTSSDSLATPLEERIEVIADRTRAFFKASFAIEYALTLQIFRCEPYARGCTQPGTIAVNGKIYDYSTDVYVPAGSRVALRAISGSDYVFTGWGTLPGVPPQNESISLVVNSPMLIAPQFKPTSGVTFQIFTEPPGLKIMADGVELQTPASLSWRWFSDHVISAASRQRNPNEPGRWWVFGSWSDGGAATHTVTVRGGLWPDSFTAKFIPATEADFITAPIGLALRVDGQECRACNFVWGLGETHTVTAPTQLDSQKLSYRFNKWSNRESNPQEITVRDLNPIRMAAVFDREGLVTIESVPRGVRMKVADGECHTPCQIQKPLGTPITITAPASHTRASGTRLDFIRWHDIGDKARLATASAEPQIVTAGYRTMNPLVASLDPPGSGVLSFEPTSPDGHYDANAVISVAVTPKPGYRFHHWEGDISGSASGGQVTMGGPRQVVARMDPIPYLPADSVRSAATDIHGTSVAACSVVSIVGLNLAAGAEKGPEKPLRQFIGGVSVRVGEDLIPLFSVSPTEIRAQMPCGLGEGRKTLIVEVGDKPKATTEFNVTRNAPGLFSNSVGGQFYAVAVHADGKPVTFDNPAKPGEVVMLYGTGLGPLMATPVDGFPIAENPSSRLADRLEILVGDDASAEVVYSGGTEQGPGVQGVRFRVGEANESVAVRVRVNGRESNSVLLPLASVR